MGKQLVAPRCITYIEVGVGGANSHGKREYMEISSPVRQKQKAALLIYRLTPHKK
jgi:hypothetical protein